MWASGLHRDGSGEENWETWRKETLSRPRRKRDDIIEIDLQEVVCGRMDCIGLGQDREIGNLQEICH